MRAHNVSMGGIPPIPRGALLALLAQLASDFPALCLGQLPRRFHCPDLRGIFWLWCWGGCLIRLCRLWRRLEAPAQVSIDGNTQQGVDTDTEAFGLVPDLGVQIVGHTDKDGHRGDDITLISFLYLIRRCVF